MRPVALVLAAGRSSRMGGAPKALLALEGRSFLAWIARSLEEGGVTQMLVVLAPGASAATEEALRLGAQVATNPLPDRGMLSSVTTGLDALCDNDDDPPADGVLLWPVDHPLVLPATVASLLEAASRSANGNAKSNFDNDAFDANAAAIVVPIHANARGHPAWFPRAFFEALRTAAPERGARAVLERPGTRVIEVAVPDEGITLDVDTPERLVEARRLAAFRTARSG